MQFSILLQNIRVIMDIEINSTHFYSTLKKSYFTKNNSLILNFILSRKTIAFYTYCKISYKIFQPKKSFTKNACDFSDLQEIEANHCDHPKLWSCRRRQLNFRTLLCYRHWYLWDWVFRCSLLCCFRYCYHVVCCRTETPPQILYTQSGPHCRPCLHILVN